MAEQRITTKPTVNALLDEDYIFINHDGALRQVRKSDADLASAEGLAAEATARQQFMTDETQARQAFEENLTEANEEFVETVDERMDAAESIVYGAFAIGTASGSVASFNDGADNIPMKSLNVTITPKQSGSGDPSPDNVRPITGWTDADVNVAGKNLFDGSFVQGSFNNNGTESPTTTRLRSGYIKVKAGSVALSTQDSNVVVHEAYTWDRNGAFVSKVQITGTGTQNGTVTIPNGASYLRFSVRHPDNSTITPTDVTAQVELGSTPTAYEPYTGHTTPVPLGQTVYGGTVNPISGELVIDRAMVQVTSAMISGANEYEYSGKNGVSFTAFPVNVDKYTGSTKGLASVSTVDAGAVAKSQYMWFGSANGNKVVYWIGILDALNMTLSEWKTWADGQSIQLIYPLATPTTVQLTPAQVASLLGDNNVWSDAGDITVEYRKDPTIALSNLEALILENI